MEDQAPSFGDLYRARPIEPACEREIVVEVVGKRCVYVGDRRIAGGKPYVSENLPSRTFKTSVREVLLAFTDSDLKAALRERKKTKEHFAAYHAAKGKAAAA